MYFNLLPTNLDQINIILSYFDLIEYETNNYITNLLIYYKISFFKITNEGKLICINTFVILFSI